MPRTTGIDRICIQCQKSFKIWPSDLNYIKAIYCSNRCQHEWQNQPHRVLEKFLSLIEINIETECWEWQGVKNELSYGIFCTNKLKIRAHRYAWELFRQPIPSGLFLCHHCDNPACINPDHMFVGTQADNVKDMEKKGRRRNKPQPGEKNYFAKLNEEQVRTIFFYKGHMSAKEMATLFHITTAAIWFIWSGRTWKHLNLLSHNDSSNTNVPVSNV